MIKKKKEPPRGTLIVSDPNAPILNRSRMSLTLVFSAFVFVVLLSAIIISAGVVFLIEFFAGEETVLDTWLTIVLMVVASAIIGYGLLFLLSKFPLKPINQLITGMSRLAAGDFHVRLEFKGVFYNNSTFKEISASFNRMAEELSNIEMLQSDFVNNFSHEFKTPIVSIAGFARLLNREDLDAETRKHYLTIIEEESRRLASLATNVLSLTRIEKQNILSGTAPVNVSESIRSAILMLEDKWSKKGIDLSLDFDEYTIVADEKLLMEVWINLIDNAIKFAPDGGRVEISIADNDGFLLVNVANEGEPIPEEKREQIFTKFYQGDRSRATEGNGIGLAIVKRVTELHGGRVDVKCSDGMNVFSIVLPKDRKTLIKSN